MKRKIGGDRFEDLRIGETFDFISPEANYNSIYDTFQKSGKRTYVSLTNGGTFTVGSVRAYVYHVGQREVAGKPRKARKVAGGNPAKRKIHFSDLSSMIRCREYDSFISDKLGSDLFINDPERAERIFEYAENGSNGSTPNEEIADWREFLELSVVSDRLERKISAEIDETERYWDNQPGRGDRPHA